MGGTGARPQWVGLCLVPLAGRTMSRGVFRSGYGQILGSLSTDGWGCVPALLVVRPEVSQPWRQDTSQLGVAGSW